MGFYVNSREFQKDSYPVRENDFEYCELGFQSRLEKNVISQEDWKTLQWENENLP